MNSVDKSGNNTLLEIMGREEIAISSEHFHYPEKEQCLQLAP